MTILYCNDPSKKGCHWSGDSAELVALGDDDESTFTHCPQCEGTDFHEEEDE